MQVHLRSNPKRSIDGLCNVTAAYLMACRNAGVELSMPEQCGMFDKIC
jgi:hypothetical protein